MKKPEEFWVFICYSHEQDTQVIHDADSACHRPNQNNGDLSMNTGIIMIGMAFVLLSVGLISSPASAAVQETSFGLSCSSGIFPCAYLAEGDDTSLAGMSDMSLGTGTSINNHESDP